MGRLTEGYIDSRFIYWKEDHWRQGLDLRIRKAGKICDNVWYLGREESGIYLVEGSEASLIISGGLCYIAPDVLAQFKEFNIDEQKIKKLLILHSHFDHIGLVPFFKDRLTDLTVYASRRAWDALHGAQKIREINSWNEITIKRMKAPVDLSSNDLLWRDGIQGISVTEGDAIDVGGFRVDIIETPGHSDCSICAYIHSIKALFSSDSGGIPYRDSIVPSGNEDYTRFQESLRKLEKLEVDYLCADHFGYVTGPEARAFISGAIQASDDFCSMIRAVYRRAGSIEKTVNKMIDYTFALNHEYFLSPDIIKGVYRSMIQHIILKMDK